MKSNSDRITQEKATAGKRTAKSSSRTLMKGARTARPGSRLMAMLLVITMAVGMVPGGLFDAEEAEALVVNGINGMPDIDITGYDVEGSETTNMTGYGTQGSKSTDILFDGDYAWLIPAGSNKLVRVDVETAEMVGFDISTYVTSAKWGVTTTDKTRGAVFSADFKYLYILPYGATYGEMLKVSFDANRNVSAMEIIQLDNTVSAPYFRGVNIGDYIYIFPSSGVNNAKVQRVPVQESNVTAGQIVTYNLTSFGMSGQTATSFYGAYHIPENGHAYKGSIWLVPHHGNQIVEVQMNELGALVGAQAHVIPNYTYDSTAGTSMAGVTYDGTYIWTSGQGGFVRIAPHETPAEITYIATGYRTYFPMSDGKYVFASRVPTDANERSGICVLDINTGNFQFYSALEGGGYLGNLANTTGSVFHGAVYDTKTNSIWLTPFHVNNDVLLRLQRRDIMAVHTTGFLDENGDQIPDIDILLPNYSNRKEYSAYDNVEIVAPSLPGYRYVKTSIRDMGGDGSTDYETSDTVTVINSIVENKEVTFHYVSIDDFTVEIYLDSNATPFMSYTLEDIAVGDDIKITPPNFTEYYLDSSLLGGTSYPMIEGNESLITKEADAQTLQLYYKTLKRKITVKAVHQADQSTPLATQEIEVYLDKATNPPQYTFDVQSLYVEGYDLIVGEPAVKVVTVEDDGVTYTGKTLVSGDFDVLFYYETAREVEIEFYDLDENRVVGNYSESKAVGDAYTIDPATHLPWGWVFDNDDSIFTGTVDDDPAKNVKQYDVKKLYSTSNNNGIIVHHVFLDENGVEIDRDTDSTTYAQTQVGTTVTLLSQPRDGYRLATGYNAAETVTVQPGANEYIFEYEPVVLGLLEINVAMEDQADPGVAIAAPFDVDILGVVGTAEIQAPDVEGYKAVGYKLADGTTSPNTAYTFTNLVANSKITFLYEKLGKLTVRSYISTHLETQSMVSEEVFYEDDSLQKSIGAYSNVPTGYKLTNIALEDGNGGASNPLLTDTLTFDAGKDQILSFYHEEITGLVTITVTGQMDTAQPGDNPLYEYDITVRTDDAPVSVTAFDLTGLKVSKTTIDGADQSGPPLTVPIDPAQINQTTTVTFTYEDDTVDVTIYAKYQDDQTKDVIQPIVLPSVIKGTQISYDSPSIPGHQLVDKATGDFIGPYSEPLTAGTSGNDIYFYYLKAEGNQEVIYWDADTNAELGRTYYDLAPDNTTTTNIAPEPIADYSTTDLAIDATWDGNGTPSPINFYYTKDQKKVILAAYDSVTGLAIENTGVAVTEEMTGLRVLESHSYKSQVENQLTAAVKQVNSEYKLDSLGNTAIFIPSYADDASGVITVPIYFTPAASAEIEVELWIGDPTDPASELFNSYNVPAAPGETITLTGVGSQIPNLSSLGFDLNPTLTKASATQGDGTKILLVYDDNRKIIQVRTFLNGVEDGGRAQTVKTEKASYDYYPSYVAGYVLEEYDLGAGAQDYADDAIAIIMDAGVKTLDLYYTDISEVIGDRSRSITVRGVETSSGQELYTYTISGDRDTLRTVTPLLVPHYTALDGAKTIEFGKDSQVEFAYASEFTEVIIEAVDENGDPIPGYYPKRYQAVIGDDYTAYAPVIEGWVVKDTGNPLDYEVTRQITGAPSTDTFTFTYVNAEGMVLVKAVEAGVPGHVLRVVGVTLADGVHTIDGATQLGSLTGWTLTGNATEQITVPGTDEVIFAYSQRDVTITVKGVEQGNATNVLFSDTHPVQEGSQFTGMMKEVSNWQLAAGEPVAKTVSAKGSTEITFAYVPQQGNITVVHKDQDTGAILDISYYVGEAGSSFGASAVDFTGYQVVGNSETTITVPASGSEVITFLYESQRANVTVELRNFYGGGLLDAYPEAGQIGVPQTIYAPPLAGFVIASSGSESMTPAGDPAQDIVAFYYKSIDDASDENHVTITIEGVTGSHTHYRYEKRVHIDEDPITLVNGADVFAVPGYVLESGQESKYTVSHNGSDVIVTFAYKSTQGEVKITLRDQSTGDLVGQGSFYVEATVGSPFTFPAPYVDGYTVVAVTPGSTAGSTIGAITEVLENTVNEIVFTYEKITSQVTIVCKEDDTNGAIIHQEGVASPQVGTGVTTPAPDLSGSFYTVIGSGQVTYDFDGTNAVAVEVYYTKDLVDIELEAVDGKTGSSLRTETLYNQRKGEVVTLNAGLVTPVGNYTLIDQPNRIVIADDNMSEAFRYNSLDDSSVMVRVYSESSQGEEIYNYPLPAMAGDVVTIDPTAINVAGYVLDASHSDNRHSVTAGDGDDIVVIMTDIRKELTVSLVDEQDGSPLGGNVEKIVSGALKTIYPTYVNGYVLIGYKLDDDGATALVEVDELFTSIDDFASGSGFADDHTVTFVYRQISDYIDRRARSIAVRGVDRVSGDPLYTYTISGDDNSSRQVSPIHVPNYTTTDTDQTVTFGTDRQVEFQYDSQFAQVRIEAVDENGRPLNGYYAKTYEAITGEDYTAYAPIIDGWVVQDTGNLTDYEITRQITGNPSTDTFLFTYVKAEGMVLVKAVEAGNFSNVLRVAGVSLTDGAHTIDAASELGAITGWSLNDSATKPVIVPDDREVTFTYDQQDVTITVRYLDWSDPSGQTEILAAGTFAAQEGSLFTGAMEHVSGWQLAAGETAAKTVYAENGAEITFSYVRSDANVVVIHKDRDTGIILDIDYLELNAGEGYSVGAIDFTGYQVATPAVVSGNAPTDGSVAVVEFEYVSLMADITVLLMSGTTLLDSDTVRGQLGVAKTIEAPHVNGYTLNDDAAKSITPTITGPNTVTFQYRSVDEVSDENHVTITVQGVTGSQIHYAYDKRVLKSSEPLTLVNGADVFAVPGYVLEDGQDSKYTVYPTADDTVSFDYKSTQGEVKITLQDQSTGDYVGQGSFYVEATVGSPFTFPAPFVDGYTVAAVTPSGGAGSFVGTITEVLPQTVNEIVFAYEKITSQVTIVGKENDANGAVIYQEGVTSPQVGIGNTIPAPDLSGSFYTVIGSGQVTYDFDGTNAVAVEVYYTKDLVDIEVEAVDGKTGSILRTETLFGQRKGEAVAVSASLVTPVGNYNLIDQPSRIVIALSGLTETFRYNSLDDSSVMVRVYSGSRTGEEIYNYPLPATAGDTVTIDPSALSIAGYVLDASHSDNRHSVIAGDGRDIVIIMTDVRKTLTTAFHDEQGGAIQATVTEKLVSGTLKTIYPGYINGYVLIGYRLTPGISPGTGPLVEIDETFTGIERFASSNGFDDDYEVTFIYRKISDYIDGRARSIAVRGVDRASGNPLYTYTISGDDGTSREVSPIHVPNYIASDSAKTVEFGKDSQVEFAYDSQLATATIVALDEEGEAIPGYHPKTYEAVIGEHFTAYAPVIEGWVVLDTGNPMDYEITKQITGGANAGPDNTFTFRYVRSEGLVLVKAVDVNDPANVLRVVGLRLADGSHTVDADALGLITGWTLSDSQTKPITVPDENELIFAYDQKLVGVDVIGIEAGNSANELYRHTHQVREGSQFTGAMDYLSNWQLADGQPVSQIIYAEDGATITFAYTAITGNVIVIHKEQATGAILDIDYPQNLEAGTTYSVGAIQFAGYQVVGDAVQTIQVPATGQAVIEFAYESQLTTVTVELRNQKDDTLIDSYPQPAQIGVSKTIAAPPLAGYVITGAGSETITPAGDPTQDVVRFYYLSVQDYVDDNFITITVRGWVENDNTPLYSYTQVRQAGSGPYAVEAMDTMGFVLAAGETGQETLNVQDEDLIHTFWYTPLATSVIIKAQLADGTAVPGFADIQAAATIGQPFSYNAPYIPGYNLVDDVTKLITPVTTEDRTLTFTYSRADGNVVIVLKENDTNGAVIKTMSDQLNEGESRTYAISDSKFDLSSNHYIPVDSNQSVTVTNDGTAQMVELYYTKALSSLYRAEYDVTTSRSLIGGPTLLADDYRVGELATVEALALSDPTTPYELVSTTPQLVIVDSDPDQIVEFEYKSIAERDVVVEAVLAGENGQNTVLQSYTVTSTEGRSVTVPAPSLTGYRLGAGQEATGSADAPGKITFVYVEDRITISVSLQDVYGNALTGPAGYADEYTVPRGLDHTVYAPHVAGYVITDRQSETYSQIDTDQYLVFTYRTVDEESDLGHVDIRIKGVTGDYVHYSYLRRFEKSDLAVALIEGLDLFYVNGYRLVPGQDLSIVSNRDYPEISFEYEQNTALVEIAAVYDDGVYATPIESFTNIYVEAEIGKPFSFITPDIEGFTATGGSGMLSEVTGNRDQDQITFYYKKGEGNVTVVAMEGTEPIGRYHTSLSMGDTVDVTRGGALDPDGALIDALQYYEPTTALGTADYEVYDGVNPVTVTFQFTKKTAPVTLIAMNTEQNGEVTRLVLDEQRVLEEFNYAGRLGALDETVAALLPGAVRVGGSTNHLVGSEAGENEILVWYVPPATSVVTVELWIDEPGSGELIQSYYLPATKNGTVTLRTGQIPDLSGLGLTYDATRSTTSAVEGTGEKILLVYQDLRVDVNVYIVKDIGVPTFRSSQKAVIGTDVLTTAPYLSGYVLKQYQISEVGTSPAGQLQELPDEFEGAKITGIGTSYDVTFYYQRIDDYVQEEYVNIIVRGLAQGSRDELYSHVVTVPKQDETIEIEAFTVSGYDLIGDDVTLVSADGGQTLVEFLYSSRQTVVTIQALLESGEPVPQFSEVTVTAELGQPFTYNAPYIPGYELVDLQSLTGRIESVSETDNKITFYYQLATGEVTVLLVEAPAVGAEDEEQTILAHYQERLVEDVPTTIPVPDLSAQYYLALDDPETVTYTGTTITVVYVYEKQTREVVYQIYDVTDPANEIMMEEIAPSERYRVGEVAAIAAPAYSGYKLVSSAVQYVLIEAYEGLAVEPEAVQPAAVILRQEVVRTAPAVETSGEEIVTIEETAAPDDPDQLGEAQDTQSADEEATVTTGSRSAKRATEKVILASAGTRADDEDQISTEPIEVDSEDEDVQDGMDHEDDRDDEADGNENGDAADDADEDVNAGANVDGNDEANEDADEGDENGEHGGSDENGAGNESDDEDGDEDGDENGNGQNLDEEPQAVRFEYTSAAENEIVINSIEDETGKLLYSYTLTGTTGERRTINAPRLAGYALAIGEEQSVVQTISGVVEFRYTQDLVVVTYLLVDENDEIIVVPDWIATEYNVARGADYTAYAPHIPGYALTGQQNQSLTNVIDPQEVTFTYRYDGSDQKRPAKVAIHYLNAEDPTKVIKTENPDGYYVGERFLLLPSLPESFNYGGHKYQLDVEQTTIAQVYLQEENVFYAYYKDNGAESTGGGGGGGGGYTTATLTVHGVDVRTGNLIYNQSVTVVVGTKETVKAPTITGYSLDAASEASQTITIESGTNLVTFNYNYTGGEVDMSGGTGGITYLSRDLLNRTDHYAYVSGYPDQTVRPEASITREEVAAIFYRILTDETRSSYFGQTNRFSDVSYGWWSNDAISTIANLGVVQGDPEGTFRPGDHITRAEMAVIVAKFSGGASTSTSDQFSDIGSHWARSYINRAAGVGFVNGDGGVGSAFRPDDNMSRAEVMALVNQLLDRIPATSVNDLDSNMIQWIDNRDAGKWYYYHVQEATNSHYYEMQESGTEKWNGLRSNRNWS